MSDTRESPYIPIEEDLPDDIQDDTFILPPSNGASTAIYHLTRDEENPICHYRLTNGHTDWRPKTRATLKRMWSKHLCSKCREEIDLEDAP